ncbi:MAG: ribosome small subunit-dependent GTPase A [Deltaproteobacteria bacterium]|nr:ribosome small subunit-dependent GTPase A [Deltaproteobacteria bacterium]
MRWRTAKGTGGVLDEVLPRHSTLRRLDKTGREQVLASNLEGVVVVLSATSPPLVPWLMDRYLVAAHAGGMRVVLCLNKVDLGPEDNAMEELQHRTALGVPLLSVSAHTGEGLGALRQLIAGARAPWALVGMSGVGKTSILAALLPELDVGPVGEISEYWEAGKHTTTGSRIFALKTGGELADSPGIRSFVPAGLSHEDVRRHFPGMAELPCRYRDCLHRPGEDGCVAPEQIAEPLLDSYRRLMAEVEEATKPSYA